MENPLCFKRVFKGKKLLTRMGKEYKGEVPTGKGEGFLNSSGRPKKPGKIKKWVPVCKSQRFNCFLGGVPNLE